MARPRSRLLDLERDDDGVLYGDYEVSAAIHAIAAWTILFLLLQLTAGFPHAAAVCAVLYGAYYFLVDRNALLGFLCWAGSGALAVRLGFSTGWKVLHTFAGCEPRPSFGAETPPPSSVYTRAQRASTVASTRRNSN